MKLFAIGLILILQNVPYTLTREVTNEDIRDAMISLIHIVRTSEDKLERHESREKALGDQIKKSLAGLEKRHRSLDPLKGAVSRLDERLSNVETILMQKDEKEKQQTQKTNDMMDALKTSLENWSANISSVIRSEIKSIPHPNNNSTDQKVSQVEDNLKKKIDVVMSSVEQIKQAVNQIKETQKQHEGCKKGPEVDVEGLKTHMKQTENLLSKYESKLTEYNQNITQLQKEMIPLEGVSLADEAWHNKMTTALESQQKNLHDIQKSLQNTEEAIKRLPSQHDLVTFKNQTSEDLHRAQYDIISHSDNSASKLSTQISDMKKIDKTAQEQLMKSITDAGTLTESIYADVSKNYEQLRTEVQSLTKAEKVIVQTADNVLDIKRRIEYGIHQILLEVGELIKIQGNDLNSTIHKRFDEIELSIVESQIAALENVSSKIETEISQVWRQIGIMYQQVTASNTALDRLQAQTELYVNGTVSTMDSMEGKVGMITSRMALVDENLNFLLGRLSLVTQEFNEIRFGLGVALDNIKGSFLAVQNKIKEVGPGPHNITESMENESRRAGS